MPEDPLFKADEYRQSPNTLQRAKSVNSLLYGSPNKPVTPVNRHYTDADETLNAEQCVDVGGALTSTPIEQAKSVTSLFVNGEGELSPASKRQQAMRPKPLLLSPASSTAASPVASPNSACALFLPVERPRDPPPAPPKAANALFQTETLHS